MWAHYLATVLEDLVAHFCRACSGLLHRGQDMGGHRLLSCSCALNQNLTEGKELLCKLSYPREKFRIAQNYSPYKQCCRVAWKHGSASTTLARIAICETTPHHGNEASSPSFLKFPCCTKHNGSKSIPNNPNNFTGHHPLQSHCKSPHKHAFEV